MEREQNEFGCEFVPKQGGKINIDLYKYGARLKVGDFREIEDETERMLAESFCLTNSVSLTPEEMIEMGEELIKMGE